MGQIIESKGSMEHYAERVKVQRGWKSPDSQIVGGQRISYTFVKPHSAPAGTNASSTSRDFYSEQLARFTEARTYRLKVIPNQKQVYLIAISAFEADNMN
jgi:hypothetical protein